MRKGSYDLPSMSSVIVIRYRLYRALVFIDSLRNKCLESAVIYCVFAGMLRIRVLGEF